MTHSSNPSPSDNNHREIVYLNFATFKSAQVPWTYFLTSKEHVLLSSNAAGIIHVYYILPCYITWFCKCKWGSIQTEWKKISLIMPPLSINSTLNFSRIFTEVILRSLSISLSGNSTVCPDNINCITCEVWSLFRSMQQVQLDKHVKLLDSPGIVMAQGATNASTVLRNCVKVLKYFLIVVQ